MISSFNDHTPDSIVGPFLAVMKDDYYYYSKFFGGGESPTDQTSLEPSAGTCSLSLSDDFLGKAAQRTSLVFRPLDLSRFCLVPSCPFAPFSNSPFFGLDRTKQV